MEPDRSKMLIHSKVTGKLYDDNKCHHILDVLKAYKFLCSGAQMIDIFPSHGSNGEERLCFVFSDEDYDLLNPLWQQHRL